MKKKEVIMWFSGVFTGIGLTIIFYGMRRVWSSNNSTGKRHQHTVINGVSGGGGSVSVSQSGYDSTVVEIDGQVWVNGVKIK